MDCTCTPPASTPLLPKEGDSVTVLFAIQPHVLHSEHAEIKTAKVLIQINGKSYALAQSFNLV